MVMSEKALVARDAGRDIGAELLQAIRDVKAGKTGQINEVKVSMAAEARQQLGLSQVEFAKMLGVSVRTFQDWEQGRREPSGAAQTLLAVATRHPEILRELVV